MHYIKSVQKLIVSIVFSSLLACGSATTSTTGNGDRDLSGTEISDSLNTAATNLAPLMVNETDGNLTDPQNLLSAAISYEDEGGAMWESIFLSGDNFVYFTDIFGSEDEAPQVVTKIRVLLDEFVGTLAEILSNDPDMDCISPATALTDSDNVTLEFYGAISNGSSGDRHFDCIFSDEEFGDTLMYGRDSNGVIYVASISDSTSTNNDQPDTRGNQVVLSQVIYTQYATSLITQASISAVDHYLDLQYAQATVYNGTDNDFSTTDNNITFKSRSRITGYMLQNADTEEVIYKRSNFTITKYDHGVNEDESDYTIVTKVNGRGDIGNGGSFIFQFDSDALDSGNEHIFCLRFTNDHPTEPASIATSNCTAYETALPWSAIELAEFPFSLSPELEANFEDQVYFETDDLIEDDGSNF